MFLPRKAQEETQHQAFSGQSHRHLCLAHTSRSGSQKEGSCSAQIVVWTQLRPREHVLQVGSGRNTPETQVPTGWPCQQAGPAEASGLMLTLPQSFSSS